MWEALTSAEFSRKYFSGFAVEMEPKLGGNFIVRAPDGSEHISGEVFEYDPPNKLTVSGTSTGPTSSQSSAPRLSPTRSSKPAKPSASP